MALVSGLLLIIAQARGGEVLSPIQPSAVQSAYGRVSEVSFLSNVTTLKPGVLAFYPDGSMKTFQFPERVWVIAYATEVLDSADQPPLENYLCHTFFGNRMPRQGEQSTHKSVYSDAFTREIRFPDGLATPMEAGEQIHWMPMFNNRTSRQAEVRMTFRVWFIRESDRLKPIRALFGTLGSVQYPDLYYVPPGRHAKTAAFTMPFSGSIHFIGTHVHPYAESVTLSNASMGQTLWKGSPQLGARGEIQSMQTYSSAEGIPIRASESLHNYGHLQQYDRPCSGRNGGPVRVLQQKRMTWTLCRSRLNRAAPNAVPRRDRE